MKWVQDFKQFALRGNVVDMAVGIVIGAAFGKIVSTFVANIISPLIGLLTGGFDFVDLKVVLREAVMEGDKVVKPELVLGYGELITVIIDFIIMAFAIFWVIRIMDKVIKQKKQEEEPAPVPPTPEDVELLREIRDLLKSK
jgi:large conductance mechanosensitive channel protein